MGFPTPSTASPNGLLTYPLDTIDGDSVRLTIPAFPWPANTPATENRQNKSYDKIKNNNNDRPDDDDDDVDCFPRQDKQPVLQQQDISPTSPIANNTSPSLIESSTDTPTTENRKHKSYDNIENDRPNDNNNNDEDKQPVLPRDISPTDTPRPSLIDPPDDDDSTVIHDNRYYNIKAYDDDDDDDDDDDTYGDCAYGAYDKYDDFAYDTDDDDDDDDSYASCSSDEDHYDSYNPNLIIDMYGNAFTLDENDLISHDDDDDDDKPMTIQAAQRQISAILAGRTTTTSIKDFTNQAKREYDEFFYSPHKNVDCTRSVPRLSSPPNYAKNDEHDAFLYHRWNMANTSKNTITTSPSTTKPAPVAATSGKTTAYAPPIDIPVKDDPSVTPTLETLCTLDTRSSQPTSIDFDVILSITIWNQPIVQYRMPIRSTTRNQCRQPSTAVQYALIGVYDKLLHPRTLPCLLYLFNSIICVVSCFTLLADSFTMVKIDDRYPDEWNDW